MRDVDLERAVADHLERRARPASPEVLDSVLGRIMSERQVAAPAARRGWLDRAALSVAVAGVLLVALIGGPAAIDRLVGPNGNGPNGNARQGGASQAPTMQWSAVLQFVGSPNQANPAGDGYGHRAVFSYLRNGGPVHDPTGYVLLREFANDGTDRWYDVSVPGLYVGFDPGTGRLELRPAGGGDEGQAAILGWRSPVDASIGVSGTVEVDATCGDGIRFSIDDGPATVQQLALSNGMEPFTADVAVMTGDTLYFIVEPGANDGCDTTWLTVSIETR